MTTFKKMTAGTVLAAASLILLNIAQSSRTFADWYSEHIYEILVNTIGRFFGIFPFSVVEIALYLLIVLLLGSFARMLVVSVQFTRRKNPKSARENFSVSSNSLKSRWKNYGANLFLLAAVLFFSYTVSCGINYGRSSFSEMEGMEAPAYTAEDLVIVSRYLTEQVNQYARKVERSADGTALIQDVPAHAQQALEHLGTKYSAMSGYYPKPKGLNISYILSVQNLTGIYSPFTIEANYNSAMTDYNLPFTACHELSHLRGFMQEEEANFIAFLACIEAEHVDFIYSGYLMGWLYTTNQLYRADYDAYESIYAQLDENARIDLAANNAFWKKYDGRIAEVASEINDNYLKANGQADGVLSYDRMVDLIMGYYQHLL